ncbi:hypothetical protein HPG69_015487 [Diceros bicornis minor]|uniref:Translin-associated protein X n=1 Tax=Diceros bicornis minor TaxID=77932 RepID=A0A7J7F247_DICBM|nr:hypothetical protein HPG69_015487 [Diceros bicornis minor]
MMPRNIEEVVIYTSCIKSRFLRLMTHEVEEIEYIYIQAVYKVQSQKCLPCSVLVPTIYPQEILCILRLQEYVEAVSFQHFIKTRSLISMDEINKQLIFTAEDNGKENTTSSSDAQDNKQCGTWRLKITPVDYLLGVADLTGELMRMCINSVGNGDIDTPFEVSQFLRHVYDGFSFIGNTGPYEVSKKLYTLKQSLAKVENACYALKVRGSEIPKHMLADVFSVKTEMIDQEEGIS